MSLLDSVLASASSISPVIENNFSEEEIAELTAKVQVIREKLVNQGYQATLDEGSTIVAFFRARRGKAFFLKEEKPVKARKAAGPKTPAKPRKTLTKEAQEKLSQSILDSL